MFEEIVSALYCMQQADTAKIKQAEEFVQQNSTKEGFIPSLLKITCTQELNIGSESDICKGAATLLRQQIEEKWNSSEEILEIDRQVVRDNIIECIIKCQDTTIISCLEDCIHLISIEDYPKRWPDVLYQIGQNLESEDPQICYSSLCSLRAIVKKYQNKLGEDRKHLVIITSTAFEVMEQLFNKHIKIFNESSVLIMTVLTKIFYIANYIELDLEYVKSKKIEIWMEYFKAIIEKDFDELEQPSDDIDELNQKEKNIVTTLLGTVCQTSYRLLQRFCNKKMINTNSEIVEYYSENLAKPLMEAHLYIISKKDKFIGRKALYFSLRFIELLIQNRNVCTLVEPHMKILLSEYLIPLLSINIQDAYEFEHNKSESIRKELADDPSHTDNCPKIAAKGLLKELCGYIPDPTYKEPALLNDFLHMCVSHLNECKQDPSIDFRVKDSTVFAIYSLLELIEREIKNYFQKSNVS